MKPTTEPRVILRHCDSYDPRRIREIVREGLAELDLRPSGKVLIKPNLVSAGPLFPHAHTHPAFGEGVLWALKDRTEGNEQAVTEFAVGERCGITIPTRVAFHLSGWDDVIERVPDIKRYLFDEVPQVEIPLRHKERLRDFIYVPQPVAEADFFVNLPKFKAHPWTTVTFSMKNYIGIQDDRHRLIDHDHRLNEKVADLQYVLQPRFIAIDAITAGEGRMLTPKPFPLRLILMGKSQVAIDAVASTIVGLSPRSIDHIRMAEDRGFGTTDLRKIVLSGDVSLAEAQKRAEGFLVGLVRVEKYFEGTKISAYAGPPPQAEGQNDYCWGGCPGAIEEAIELLRLYDEACDEKMPRLHVVFGAYRGEIPAGPGERVVFIGDCANWEGTLGGELVQIRSLYKDRTTLDPHTVPGSEIYGKIVQMMRTMRAHRDLPYVRVAGCPVSVAEQIMALVFLSGCKNPYTDPRNAVRFNLGYVGWRASQAYARLSGQPYQTKGPCQRGLAATLTHREGESSAAADPPG